MTDPLSYATPSASQLAPISTHEVIYRVLLGVFGGMVLFGGAIVVVVFLTSPNQVPKWMILFLGCFYSALSLGSFAVLALRIFRRGRFRWITLTWNIILLFMIPFGTAIGIYGLIVLDRQPPAYTNPVG